MPDEAVGINSMERFLGDQAIKYDCKIETGESTGKRVMVVGAGPGGLAAAYHLRRLGHAVTVFESAGKAGGMLRWGIPKYRLPREKLNAEIDRSDAPRTIRPSLEVVRRQSGFAEVIGDLNEENALFEARRCMSCGNCFECDNCYGVCPDNAITKLGEGKRFEFKYDYCKGCGMCVTECPCGAINIVPEEI